MKTVLLTAIVLGASTLLGCSNRQLEQERAERQALLAEQSKERLAQEAAQKKADEEAQRKATEEATSIKDDEVEIHMFTNGISMMFNLANFTAPAGSTVHLFFENRRPGNLAHNWVLVNAGKEADVAAEGLKKGEAAGYLAEGPDVLAHTDLILPGKTTELRFKAPTEPGKYPYICSFPGHYMMMKGVLEVTPAKKQVFSAL
jgi:azurin